MDQRAGRPRQEARRAPAVATGAKPRVLVTGAGGFLGCRTVECLHLGGAWDVRALVRRPGSAARLARFPVDIVLGDVTLGVRHGRAPCKDCDSVVHCAVGTGWPPEAAFAVTVDGTKRTAEAALGGGGATVRPHQQHGRARQPRAASAGGDLAARSWRRRRLRAREVSGRTGGPRCGGTRPSRDLAAAGAHLRPVLAHLHGASAAGPAGGPARAVGRCGVALEHGLRGQRRRGDHQGAECTRHRVRGSIPDQATPISCRGGPSTSTSPSAATRASA